MVSTADKREYFESISGVLAEKILSTGGTCERDCNPPEYEESSGQLEPRVVVDGTAGSFEPYTQLIIWGARPDDVIATGSLGLAADDLILSRIHTLQGQLNESFDLEPDFKARLEDTLRSALSFEENWDGHDGVVPKNEAVEDAVAFLTLIPSDVDEPRPLIAGDGEVGVYWKRGRAYIEVGFYGDGIISYVVRDSDGNIVSGEEAPFSRECVPLELVEAIEKFSGLP